MAPAVAGSCVSTSDPALSLVSRATAAVLNSVEQQLDNLLALTDLTTRPVCYCCHSIVRLTFTPKLPDALVEQQRNNNK